MMGSMQDRDRYETTTVPHGWSRENKTKRPISPIRVRRTLIFLFQEDGQLVYVFCCGGLGMLIQLVFFFFLIRALLCYVEICTKS